MKNLDKVPNEEKMHFIKCPKCGEYFDRRDLAQISDHVHAAEPKWTRERRVGHPEESLIQDLGKTVIYLN